MDIAKHLLQMLTIPRELLKNNFINFCPFINFLTDLAFNMTKHDTYEIFNSYFRHSKREFLPWSYFSGNYLLN
jgi:hypothetical protein